MLLKTSAYVKRSDEETKLMYFSIKDGDEVTYFYDKGIPKVDFNHTCLAVMRLDFVLKKYESYYLQFLFKRVQIY